MTTPEENNSSPESGTEPTTPPVEEQQQQEQTPEPVDDNGEQEAVEEVQPLTAESITLPEGLEMPEETMSAFLDIANNAELTPDARAQAFIDLHAQAMQSASERVSEVWQEQRAAWVDEVQNDPEFGGNKLEPALTEIAKVVDKFGGDDLRTLMDDSGLGDHPVMVRFFHRISKEFAEGEHVSGTPTASSPKSQADRLYSAS